MAAITHLSVTALPGSIRTFLAKVMRSAVHSQAIGAEARIEAIEAESRMYKVMDDARIGNA